MDKPQILKRLEELRISVSFDDDRIKLRPASRVPPALAEQVRHDKSDVLAYLRQSRSILSGSTVGDRNQATGRYEELKDIERLVRNKGYVLLSSTVLNDLVTFYRSAEDLAQIPPGFVPYSVAELWHLFGNEGKDLSGNALRLIHEAKKVGAIVTDVKDDDK